jgi:Subtilase family
VCPRNEGVGKQLPRLLRKLLSGAGKRLDSPYGTTEFSAPVLKSSFIPTDCKQGSWVQAAEERQFRANQGGCHHEIVPCVIPTTHLPPHLLHLRSIQVEVRSCRRHVDRTGVVRDGDGLVEEVRGVATALAVLDDLSELRRPGLTASTLTFEAAEEQAEWVQQLADRTRPADQVAPAVCVLDTGVFNDHPLLSKSLPADDCHACHPDWLTHDSHGHGTEMAGLSLYGDLAEAISAKADVHLRHHLESVKILPPHGANDPPNYGAITATTASLVEIQQPARHRVYCMAVTTDVAAPEGPEPQEGVGQPTAWSATIDALTSGALVGFAPDGSPIVGDSERRNQRLFLVSAGNIQHDQWQEDYLTRCQLTPVEDPGQSWNAVTVGANTELYDLSGDANFNGWFPVAKPGDISPFSRTSALFEKRWPLKPDIVLEGGNLALSLFKTEIDHPEALQVLTAKAPIHDQRLLTVTHGTSPATAQAAFIAASIASEYPNFWPETLRALVVHSAEWTTTMLQQLGRKPQRGSAIALHRIYGMGVPSLERATRSAADALTLIAQDVIHPFDGDGNMGEMNLHVLPWPSEVLTELGEAEVRLRVTLSYFIDPSPTRRGWRGRYTYASHNLRFDLRKPEETTDEFRKRVNHLAHLEDEGRAKSASDAEEWRLGPDARTAGSIHSDIWEGEAARLAERGVLAVWPVSGWWKEQKSKDRSAEGCRYALIVSIETPGQEVDIWTPVANQVGIEIEV